MTQSPTSFALRNNLWSLPVPSSAPTDTTSADPAREAYDDAVKLFNEKLTNDECKRIWLCERTGFEQVKQAVFAAKRTYETSSKRSKTRKWITRFSSRVMYYSKVMDVLVQQHPEYVSLAWGAMKFLFIVSAGLSNSDLLSKNSAYRILAKAVLNHEELLAQLCKAFSQIADALPRVDVKLLLFPTEEIRNTVATLYGQVIKFLQRAMSWYAEGKMKHIISSIFRPFELTFKDFVDEIRDSARKIDELAVAAAQGEQRHMHLLMQEMKWIIIGHQAANSRVFLDSARRICEIQFSQILTFTATTSLLSPEESFRYCQFLTNRRRRRVTIDANSPWRSRRLQEWASAKVCSLILVKGSYTTRYEAKDFATDIVGLLCKMKIPVIWTLSARADGNVRWRSPIDVLKQLVMQVLHINSSLLTEQSPALNAARFQSATTELQWFDLLASVLSGLPQIYIVVDAEVLSEEFSSQILWPTAFLKLFDDIAKRFKTIVKVVLISYSTSRYVPLSSSASLYDMTIRIDRDRCSSRKKQRFRSARRHQASKVLRQFILESKTAPP